MINYYQPFLLPFLRTASYRIPDGIRQTYFLSFEDALWVLLRRYRIPKRSAVLVPDFYCMDVVDNIRRHGYRPVLYPVDRWFRSSKQSLMRAIRTYDARVVILFHACGLPAMPSEHIAALAARFPDTIVIEDMVHTLTDPERVTLTHPNHVMMDSLRKVSPLPGSFVYQSVSAPALAPDRAILEPGYVIQSVLRYALFRMILVSGSVLHRPDLVSYAHTRVLKWHDDLIGDSTGGYGGNPVIPFLHRHFDFSKIKKTKIRQAGLYRHELSRIPRTLAMIPPTPESVWGMLHVFPLIVSIPAGTRTQAIERQLLRQGIVCWFKFPDAPWSRKRSVLFLPLGFHIRPGHIRHIGSVVRQVLETSPATDRPDAV